MFVLIILWIVTNIPLQLQKMLIRFFEPILLGGLTLLWLQKSIEGIVLFALACLMMVVGMTSYYWHYLQREHLATVKISSIADSIPPTSSTPQPRQDQAVERHLELQSSSSGSSSGRKTIASNHQLPVVEVALQWQSVEDDYQNDGEDDLSISLSLSSEGSVSVNGFYASNYDIPQITQDDRPLTSSNSWISFESDDESDEAL